MATRRLVPRRISQRAQLTSVVCLLQHLDVDFLHLEHGFHDPLRFPRIGVTQQVAQDGGIDLPRQSVLVLQPAAWPLLAAFGELFPELVHFFLSVAVHGERYGLGEFELGPTVQRDELLALELKYHGHHATLWPRACLSVTSSGHDPGILEDRDIKLR